jgi:hypothetical protein
VITYDAYSETLEELKQKDRKLEGYEKKQNHMMEVFELMMDRLVSKEKKPLKSKRLEEYRKRATYAKLFTTER